MFKLHIHKATLKKDPLLSITIDLNKKKFYFLTDWRKKIYLIKDFFRHVFMNIKLVYVCIIRKKISSFTPAIMEIFNFYFGKLNFGLPFIWPKSHYIYKQLNISATARANGLIFLPIIEACLHFKSIRRRLERAFIKYH